MIESPIIIHFEINENLKLNVVLLNENEDEVAATCGKTEEKGNENKPKRGEKWGIFQHQKANNVLFFREWSEMKANL